MSDHTLPRSTMDVRLESAALQSLSGLRRGPRAILPFVGPAVVASVAYVDPGNFATNIQGGAGYGYQLLWVVVLANLTAMLFQGLSARLGIVTGRSLPAMCRIHFSRNVVWGMWISGEVAAMATDLAEFLGASIGLSLLIGIPLLAGMVITGIVTYAILALQRHGARPLEIVITAMVGVICLAYLAEIFIAHLDWGAVALHSVKPELADAGAVTLAVGIVGATVMPHAIYLHSSLTANRIRTTSASQQKQLIRMSDREVIVALAIAGLVNMAMLAMAAAVFHDGVHEGIAEIEDAYRTLTPLLGSAAAGIFLVSLLSSGLSSSVVGTMAGQVIMQDFVGFRIPIWLRRAVTMLPAFVVVALGIEPTSALVISQVVLSLILPVPMIALVMLSARRSVMGDHALRPSHRVLAITVCAFVGLLNVILIAQTLGVALPGLG
jgi:manganese transport protein